MIKTVSDLASPIHLGHHSRLALCGRRLGYNTQNREEKLFRHIMTIHALKWRLCVKCIYDLEIQDALKEVYSD